MEPGNDMNESSVWYDGAHEGCDAGYRHNHSTAPLVDALTTGEHALVDFAVSAQEGIAAERPELDALVETYAVARSSREAAGDVEKQARKVEDEAERQLFDSLERLNLRQVRHKTLGLFTMNDLASAVVTDEALLRAWALKEMPELLLANRQRLGKIIRDALKEDGGTMPPGTDVAFKRGINWRRGPA